MSSQGDTLPKLNGPTSLSISKFLSKEEEVEEEEEEDEEEEDE